VRFFVAGGVFLVVTSLLDTGEATRPKIVLEESARLLDVVSSFLGHLAAFAGAVRDPVGLRTATSLKKVVPSRINKVGRCWS
jgi:hypothetical protein